MVGNQFTSARDTRLMERFASFRSSPDLFHADNDNTVAGSQFHDLIEKYLPFVFTKKMCKRCYEMAVRLILAPVNFKPFALISPLPHAFRLWRYPVGRATLAAQRRP